MDSKYSEIFAAAFAAQQITEFLDSLILAFLWKTFDEKKPEDVAKKKAIDKIIATLFACVAVFCGKLAIPDIPAGWIASLVTIFAIAAGTDGVNSLLKVLAYAKDGQKASAAAKRSALAAGALDATART